MSGFQFQKCCLIGLLFIVVIYVFFLSKFLWFSLFPVYYYLIQKGSFDRLKMAEEIEFENRHFWKLKSLVTLTLTSDDLESHIIVNISSTSNTIPSFIKIGQKFSHFFRKVWSHVTRTLGGNSKIRPRDEIFWSSIRNRWNFFWLVKKWRKIVIFESLSLTWPWPWPRMTMQVISLRMSHRP